MNREYRTQKPTIKTRTVSSWVCLGIVIGTCFLPTVPEAHGQDPNYVLQVSAPSQVTGNPGEVVQLEAVVRLTALQNPVQGWSLSITPTDTSLATIVAATTQGTVGAAVTDTPPGLRDAGFERTELSLIPVGGALSAIVLSFVQPITLTPGSSYDLFRVTVETTIPPAGNAHTITLALIDGLQGTGQPVDNRLTVGGTTVVPTVVSADVMVGPIGEPTSVLGSSFTYQGRLEQTGSPFSGLCDFEVSLWKHPTSTEALLKVGETQTITGVSVQEGLFAVLLNAGNEFGVSPFEDLQTWLEIAVRAPVGSGSFMTLSPRQQISVAPQAVFAKSTPWEGLTSVPAGLSDSIDNDLLASLGCAQNNSVPSFHGSTWTCRVLPSSFADGFSLDAADGSPADALYVDNLGRVGIGTTSPSSTLQVNGPATAASFSGSGSGLTALNASQLTSGTVPDARLSSNVARRSGGNAFTGNQSFTGGNVGIGTPTAVSELEVNGTLTTDDINFPAVFGQKLTLYNSDFGVGMQAFTTYFRTESRFGWYKQGVHAAGLLDPGAGGTVLMSLNDGGLTVNGTFVSSSDRHAKENFQPVDPCAVLEKVVALPLSQWNYRNDPGTRHVGPVAQDFHAAFGVGPDDKHIATVDADGVALAAIQGLNQKVEGRIQHAERRIQNGEQAIQKLRAENTAWAQRFEQKETEITELRQTVNELKRLVQALNHQLNGGAQ